MRWSDKPKQRCSSYLGDQVLGPKSHTAFWHIPNILFPAMYKRRRACHPCHQSLIALVTYSHIRECTTLPRKTNEHALFPQLLTIRRIHNRSTARIEDFALEDFARNLQGNPVFPGRYEPRYEAPGRQQHWIRKPPLAICAQDKIGSGMHAQNHA